MTEPNLANGTRHVDGDDLDKAPPTSVHPFKVNTAYLEKYSPATLSVHGDDPLNVISDVAPPLHVSTTFRYSRDPNQLRTTHNRPSHGLDPGEYVYSRLNTSSVTRLEQLLSTLLHNPTIVYSSGLASFHALLTHLNPKRIAIGAGYHGCHGVLDLHVRLTGAKILSLDCKPEDLNEGDLLHLETPINPTGLAFNIAHYAALAHSRGAYLSVDSTFGPPPLQDPFLHGADVVMHSGTKYIGGHSDMLCGILALRNHDWVAPMLRDRMHLGSTIGGLESWLGIRSVRTLQLRVMRQSETATALVTALHAALAPDAGGLVKSPIPLSSEDVSAVKYTVKSLQHASLQLLEPGTGWLTAQMPHGFGPVFQMTMHSPTLARRLPSKLRLFHHATSLGGVESLIEWRTMTDDTVAPDVLRVSVGVEDVRDLAADLCWGLRELAAEIQEGVERDPPEELRW